MCSCSVFFFAAAHFHLVSISSFSHRLFKLSNFSSNEIGLSLSLFFLSNSLTLSLLSTSMQTSKLKSKDRIRFVVVVVVVVFISKSSGSYAIYRRNAWVLQSQNFIRAYMKGRRTYGRFAQNPNFLDSQITKFSYPWCFVIRFYSCMFTFNIKHTKYLLEYVFHRYDSLSIMVFINQ